VNPVVLLIVDVYLEILLEYLVESLSLTIRFWVVHGGEVGFDVEHVAQGFPEPGHKVFTLVRHYIGWCAVFRKHMTEKKEGDAFSIHIVMCGYEESHFR